MSNLPIREAGVVLVVGLSFFLIQTILSESQVDPMGMFPVIAVAVVLWLIDAVLMGRRDREESVIPGDCGYR